MRRELGNCKALLLHRAAPYGRVSALASANADRRFRRRGLSIAEMMIAVVILGIGLLITSSMFPIAWYKARDVAEMTTVHACTDAADTTVKLLCRVNGPRDSVSENTSAFFPGDWFVDGVNQAPDQWQPMFYPDTRVHHLNLGNYLAGLSSDMGGPVPALTELEQEWLCPTDCMWPVADNTWAVEDSLLPRLVDVLYRDNPGSPTDIRDMKLHLRCIAGHDRVFPPLERQPLPSADESIRRHWRERFNSRRYCWSVFYRFSEMPGPSGSSQSLFVDPIYLACTQDSSASPDCNRLLAQGRRLLDEALAAPRVLTMYYFTLKRPEGARYARQVGYELSSNTWPAGTLPDTPRALPPELDVVMPVPWRMQALLLTPVDAGSSGVPADIQVTDPVSAGMLQGGSYLIDESTGQVFRVANRRVPAGSLIPVTLTLDKEYTPESLTAVPDHAPFPQTIEACAVEWQNYWNCTEGLEGCVVEDQPAVRTYWVFPPAVEPVRVETGVPTFDGSQPVIGLEVRQMQLAPRM